MKNPSRKYRRKSKEGKTKSPDAMSMSKKTQEIYKRREIEDSIPTVKEVMGENKAKIDTQQARYKPMANGRVSRGR